MVREIQCRANAILFKTRQSTHATGERKITNYKIVPGNGFSGKVKGVQLSIVDARENSDHLVSPQEAVRIAMARQ